MTAEFQEKRNELIALQEHLNDQHGVAATSDYAHTDPAQMDEGTIKRWAQRYFVIADRPPETDAEWDAMRDGIRERQERCAVDACPGLENLKNQHDALYAEVKALTPPRVESDNAPVQEVRPNPLAVPVNLGVPGG